MDSVSNFTYYVIGSAMLTLAVMAAVILGGRGGWP